MLETQCPACGVLFRKWLAARAGLPTRAATTAQARQDRAGSRLLAWQRGLLDIPEEGRTVRAGAGAALWLLAAWSVWRFARFDISAPESIPLPFLHTAIVPFHEFGHILFKPFGEFMHVAGGSLMQFLMPLGFGAYFVHWRRDNLAGSLMPWWAGMQWVDLAPYCDDARTPVMTLLTGRTGDTGAHDYIDMLGDLGLLDQAHEVAAIMKNFGIVLMLLALVWGALLLERIWRNRAGGA